MIQKKVVYKSTGEAVFCPTIKSLCQPSCIKLLNGVVGGSSNEQPYYRCDLNCGRRLMIQEIEVEDMHFRHSGNN